MVHFKIIYSIYLLFFTAIANGYIFIRRVPQLIALWILAFLLLNVLAGTLFVRTKKVRFRILHHGATLLELFVHSLLPSFIIHCIYLVVLPKQEWSTVLWSAIICIIFEAAVFWNGILCVYTTSVQLRIKQRVVGALCGVVPIVNLIILFGIIKTTKKEIRFESEKEHINELRADKKICATKYPILMVHGVFFRDSRYLNYWGRVPKELILNGATIYYGNHQSAASVADSAEELSARIKDILAKAGCEKLNIIAHSKGGLDCRYAIENLGIAPYVASLTTINTPHRGCLFADHLLTEIPETIKYTVASTYNAAFKKLGDERPDFLAAVNDLTAAKCTERITDTTVEDGIFRQSVGSILRTAGSGTFPLNFSYHLVKHFDGKNDGLVSEKSFAWGEKYTLLSAPGARGISHGDMIDLNRENIDGFDVREFYVGLVSDLKLRGL